MVLLISDLADKILIAFGLFGMMFAFGFFFHIALPKLWERLQRKSRKQEPLPEHSPEFWADQVILLKDSLTTSHEDMLQDMFSPLSDDVRAAWRRCADAIIEGREQAGESELWSLLVKISPFATLNLPPRSALNSSSLFGRGDLENQDIERCARLSAIYQQVRRQNTALKVKCPACRRSLKGITEAMIGDNTVCPKCKAEFTIKGKNNNGKKN